MYDIDYRIVKQKTTTKRQDVTYIREIVYWINSLLRYIFYDSVLKYYILVSN